MAINKPGEVNSLTANTTPAEITLDYVNPDTRVWYEFADVAGDVELCWDSADTAGIRISTTTITKGPFRAANAPRFFRAASSTALRVTVIYG